MSTRENKYLRYSELNIIVVDCEDNILLMSREMSGNCYDAHQYGNYSLYCPYAHRLPNGTILAKDLAAEYNYLGNSSIWFYNARRKAQEIIDKNAPIYRGQ